MSFDIRSLNGDVVVDILKFKRRTTYDLHLASLFLIKINDATFLFNTGMEKCVGVFNAGGDTRRNSLRAPVLYCTLVSVSYW